MTGLNYLCENDISDDDCLQCGIHGIKFSCPDNCPDFRDVRESMTPEMLAERDRLIKIMGVKDDPKWERRV
jgi:hypothetical protein